MGFPVYINGNTYNESDFTGYGYKTALPSMINDTVTVAGDVATDAATASAAASVASTAANNAAASYDAFDDRYLGAKAADPTLDNDGNALLTGALYFNTVANAMKVYTGSAWGAAYVPGGSYLSTADIGVTVQGYDATTLKSTTIGVTVQAYDADTAKLDVQQSWTKPQRPSLQAETAPSSNTITWDLTDDQVYQLNLNANVTTFNLTGTLASLIGNQYQLIVRYNGGTTITWNSNFKWPAATAPTLTGTSGKIDIFNFTVCSTNGGTTCYLFNTGKSQNIGA